MRIIGLTGGIASGKTTVANMLRRLGAYVIDADEIAREIVRPGTPAWEEIVALFGEQVLLPDGTLDRKKLGEIVFADETLRHKLEAVTHPRIWEVIKERLKEAKTRGVPIAVLDVPLLIESGWYKRVDRVWLVYTDRDIQVRRLMARDNLTLEAAAARLAAQMPLDAKVLYADVVIDNAGSAEQTEATVRKAWGEELQRGRDSGVNCP